MAERISVKEAAKLTGLSEQLLREGLKCGALEFGRGVKTSNNKYTYHISPNKLREYLGLIDKQKYELDELTVTDAKVKLLEDKILDLEKTESELKLIINSMLDCQEYIIKRINGFNNIKYPLLYNSAINDFRKKSVNVPPEEKVTVKRAAELMGASPIFIHRGLISGNLPFGYVSQKKLFNGKYITVYHIYAGKLAEYLGISIEEVKGE